MDQFSPWRWKLDSILCIEYEILHYINAVLKKKILERLWKCQNKRECAWITQCLNMVDFLLRILIIHKKFDLVHFDRKTEKKQQLAVALLYILPLLYLEFCSNWICIKLFSWKIWEMKNMKSLRYKSITMYIRLFWILHIQSKG